MSTAHIFNLGPMYTDWTDEALSSHWRGLWKELGVLQVLTKPTMCPVWGQ